MKDFQNREFVVIDVETTGLSPAAGHRIVEIAALKIRDLKPCEEFHALLDPQRDISWGASQVNGISRDMLIGKPRAQEILPDILRFIEGCCLVGHNLQFDLNFITHELSRCGLQLRPETVTLDTIHLARKLMPHLGRYPLWRVAQSLGIKEQQKHRALADVYLTWEVFSKLLTIAQEREAVRDGI